MKLLSRKVLASIVVFVSAFVLRWFGLIGELQFIGLAIATAVGYIAGENVGHLVYFIRNQKLSENGKVDQDIKSSETFSELKFREKLSIRLKNLFDPSFIAAICVYIVMTFSLYKGMISADGWVWVAIATIVGYDLVNPLEKLK